MNFLNTLEHVAKGATTGVVVLTALPVLGAAGTITATGALVGSILGAAAAILDSLNDK
jgi:hypothetical protein